MWLAISSIVLAAAIGFNVLADGGGSRGIRLNSRPAQSGTRKLTKTPIGHPIIVR
jgi:hypothetical protein